MRTFTKPIELIAYSDETGVTTPLKFKIKTKDDIDLIIRVDKVILRELEKLAGNVMILYKCRGIVEGKEREYELKYEINSCKWMMWRM